MKLLSESEVFELVDPRAAIQATKEAFKLLSTGRARVPLRTEIPLADGGVFFVMPGLVAEKFLGFKLIANRPDPEEPSGLRTLSMIMVVDARSLVPIGLMSSDWFTDFRTAAGFAAATDELASPVSRTMAIFGAGKLAEPTVRLLLMVRRFERVVLVGRTPSRVEALAERLRTSDALAGVAVEVAADANDAAAAADVITTVTTATEPVFDGANVRPGTHVNVGGAYRPDWRETDDALAGRAVVYMDSAEACLSRAGDICIPLKSGVLTRDRIRGEIGELFAGSIPGRLDRSEITVFKSLGNAVQDLYLAGEMLADTKGIGQEFLHD